MHGDGVEDCIYGSGQPYSSVTVGLCGDGVECMVECMAMKLRTVYTVLANPAHV